MRIYQTLGQQSTITPMFYRICIIGYFGNEIWTLRDFVFMVCTRDICLFWQRDPSSVAPGLIFFVRGIFPYSNLRSRAKRCLLLYK